MTSEQIHNKIIENNNEIERILTANRFTLNIRIQELLEENKELQKECDHLFENGVCVYCFKEAN